MVLERWGQVIALPVGADSKLEFDGEIPHLQDLPLPSQGKPLG